MILGTATAATAARMARATVASRPQTSAAASEMLRKGLMMSSVNAIAPAFNSESRLDMITETNATSRSTYPSMGVVVRTSVSSTWSSSGPAPTTTRATMPSEIMIVNQTMLNIPARIKLFLEMLVVCEARARFA